MRKAAIYTTEDEAWQALDAIPHCPRSAAPCGWDFDGVAVYWIAMGAPRALYCTDGRFRRPAGGTTHDNAGEPIDPRTIALAD